jgi:hypothetical protein
LRHAFYYKRYHGEKLRDQLSAGADRSESATGNGSPATQTGSGGDGNTRRFTPAGFSVTVATWSRLMPNLSCFLPGPLTGHGNAITGRVGLAQFPQPSRDQRLQNT